MGWGSIECGRTIQIGEGRICCVYRSNSFMPTQFPSRKTLLHKQHFNRESPGLCWTVKRGSGTKEQLQWPESAEMKSLKLQPEAWLQEPNPDLCRNRSLPPLPNEWENTYFFRHADKSWRMICVHSAITSGRWGASYFLFISVLIRAGRWATGVSELTV